MFNEELSSPKESSKEEDEGELSGEGGEPYTPKRVGCVDSLEGVSYSDCLRSTLILRISCNVSLKVVVV